MCYYYYFFYFFFFVYIQTKVKEGDSSALNVLTIYLTGIISNIINNCSFCFFFFFFFFFFLLIYHVFFCVYSADVS